MRRIHYGWVVCGACTLLMICTMGLCSNVFTVYLPYLRKDGLSGAACSLLLSVRCLFSLLSMLAVNRYYRRLHLRAGVGVACLLAGVSCLVDWIGGSAAVYAAGAALAGVSYGLGSMIPVSILIDRWFTARRGLALGICASGSGIATICFPPLITLLAESRGLRAAFFWEAVFVLASGLLVYRLLRAAPEELHLAPVGGEKSVRRTADAPAKGGRPLSGAGWGVMAAVLLLTGGVSAAGTGHLSLLMTSCGLDAGAAALCVSVFGVALTLGKFLYGGAVDRAGVRRATAVFCGLLAAGCLLAASLRGQDALGLAVAALLGLGFPPSTVGVALWAADFSSGDGYPRTLQRFQLLYALGGMLLSSLPGWIGDHTGEYRSAYVLMGAAVLLSTGLLLGLYRAAEKRT